MKYVVLDTNFILTCVKQKIDFFNELELLGMQIFIPTQVIDEIEKVMVSKQKMHFREDAALALKLLKTSNFHELDLNTKYVDRALKEFAKKNRQVIIATLDKDIKRSINNPKLVIRGKKKLEII